MGTTACGRRGFKGRAAICGDQPMGASSYTQQHTQVSCPPTPHPPPLVGCITSSFHWSVFLIAPPHPSLTSRQQPGAPATRSVDVDRGPRGEPLPNCPGSERDRVPRCGPRGVSRFDACGPSSTKDRAAMPTARETPSSNVS